MSTIPVFAKFVSAFGGLLFDPRTPTVTEAGAVTLVDETHSGRFVDVGGAVTVPSTLPDGFFAHIRNNTTGSIRFTVSGVLGLQGDPILPADGVVLLIKGSTEARLVLVNSTGRSFYPPASFKQVTGNTTLTRAADNQQGIIVAGATSAEIQMPDRATDSQPQDFYWIANHTDGAVSIFVEGQGTDTVAGEIAGFDTLLNGESGLYVPAEAGVWRKIASAQDHVVPPWPLSSTLSGETLNILAGLWISTYRNTVIQGQGTATLPATAAAAVAIGTGLRFVATATGGITVNVRNPGTETIRGEGTSSAVSEGQELFILKHSDTEWVVAYSGAARPLVSDSGGPVQAGVSSWAGLDRAINQAEIEATLTRYGYQKDPGELLAEATKTGTDVDLSANVRVDPANVVEAIVQAAPPLVGSTWIVVGQDFTEQTIGIGTPVPAGALRFASLQGGTLVLAVAFAATSISGFPPELLRLELEYGSGGSAQTFVFPLQDISAVDGVGTVTITIPDVDYSALLNDNPNIRLVVDERGASFRGTITIGALQNRHVGRLHDSISFLAQEAATNAVAPLNSDIARLEGREQDFEHGVATSFTGIEPRLSPLRTDTLHTPEHTDVFFENVPTGDPNPLVSQMDRVSGDNPTFVYAGQQFFVAAPVAAVVPTHSLENITQATITNLTTANAGTDPNLEIIASQLVNQRVFALYRVTGATSGDVFQVLHNSSEQVIAWQEDIDDLQADVEDIRHKLDHPVLALPADVVGVLENDVTVTQVNALAEPTQYNRDLGTGAAAKVLNQSPATGAPAAGRTSSNALNGSPASTRGRKLFVSHNHALPGAGIALTAPTGTPTDLAVVSPDGLTINAVQFVPGQAATNSNETIYPAPSTRVSGAGIWQTIETLTFRNGIPVTEADELFFTRNIPTFLTTIAIQYRGHANGNIFGANSTTLALVGGSSDVSTTFVLDDGGEQATVEVLWRAVHRDIRVSVTERVRAGLPTINDVQVILSYSHVRPIPARPATTRQVPIADVGPAGTNLVLMAKPSVDRVSNDGGNNPTLLLVGNRAEVDTGYGYDALFGNDDAGVLSMLGEEISIYNVLDSIDVVTPLLRDFESRASLPNDGFFTDDHSHETLVAFDTQLGAENAEGDVVSVGALANKLATDSDTPGTTYRVTGIDVTGGTAVLRVEVVT